MLFRSIAGDETANSYINDCINNGTVKAIQSRVGGIVGVSSKETVIINCKNKGNIISEGKEDDESINASGGIVGRANGGIISNSSNTGNVTATVGINVGGILGIGREGVKVDGCYNYNGSIKGLNKVAGIVGDSYGMIISNCYNYLSSNNYYINGNNPAGILGRVRDISKVDNVTKQKTIIENCYTIGENISSSTYSGAIIGAVGYETEIKNTYILSTTALKGIGEERVTLKIKQITKKDDYLFKTSVTNSTSVAYLLNNSSTKGKWKQSSNINGGYPYLANNIP